MIDNTMLATQKILSESYGPKKDEEIHIVYEEGHPLNYRNEFKELWLTHMEHIRLIQNFPLPKVTENTFNESLKNFVSIHEDARLFIAKDKKNLIGFLQAGMLKKNQYGFISDLHVSDSYRNFGIGTILLEKCFSWYEKNGIKEIDVEVTGGNENVLRFYKKNNFKVDSYTLKRNGE